MANPWFKMPSGKIRNDAKIAQLSQRDQRHYFWLLLLKNDGVLDNLDDAQDEELPEMLTALDKIVANALWVSSRQADALKQRLMKVRLIDETWQPIFWDALHGEHAFTSQDEPARRAMTVAERVKNCRARKKAAEALAATNTDKTAATDVTDVTDVTGDVTHVTIVTNGVTHVTNDVTEVRYTPVTQGTRVFEKTNSKTMTYDDVTLLLKEEDADGDEDSYGEEEKSKAKSKEREGDFSEITPETAHADPKPPAVQYPMPAPLAQATSPFDGWIFAGPDPAELEPVPAPEPTAIPELASASSVQADPLFDDSLFADEKFALTPEDEAEVNQILFGKPPPPQLPSAEAEEKPRKAKTRAAASRAERATRIAENWMLSDENRQWAKEKRPDLDIDIQAERFHNHWLGKGGKDARRVDWDATWRNWVLGAWDGPRFSTGHQHSRHTLRHDPLEILAI